ncbi:MAG: hypothetical protein II820_00755 [Ruminiclostridium sp.]|nr:hypothetical protein [Ruminiclostridium sp.]
MTVKVMTYGEAPTEVPAAEKPAEKAAPVTAEKPRTDKEPLVYLPAENGYELPRVRFRGTSRRRNMSFGGTVLVQLAVSCAAAAALWAGLKFGGEEVKQVCVNIAELFK